MSERDEILMAEKIGELQRSLKTANQKVADLRDAKNQLKRRLMWDKWWHVVIAAFAVGFVLLCGGYPLFKHMTAIDIPTHCYVKKSGVFYSMHASIDWREDKLIGMFCTIDDAKKMAEEISCEIKGSMTNE